MKRATATFEEALSKIQPAADRIVTTLRGLADSPSEIQVQFGVNLSANAGAVLAAASIGANYTVTLTWRKDDETSK